MKIEDLGFDDWFLQESQISENAEYGIARVAAVDKNQFVIRNEKASVVAEVTGKLIYDTISVLDFPTVGDWVKVQYFNKDTFAIIHSILPRKSLLKRKMAGNKVEFQSIAANIDIAFIMQASDYDFNIPRLERYLTMINEAGIKPVILLSKIDLISTEDLNKKISDINNISNLNEIIAFSNKTGQGLSEIKNIIKPGKTCCLLGSSGVGKTTLLNNIIGEVLYTTDTVCKKDGKGKHITTRRQLIILKDGGLIIDTPGMRELGNIGVSTGINETFRDIYDLAKGCKFKDCTHTVEPGCQILESIKKGLLNDKHYRNFLKLQKESKHYEMTYLEKRKKDHNFGKFIKQAMKGNKKK
jgi:ribosome biogenesis GTPase / thiamine phosphate phosphatase